MEEQIKIINKHTGGGGGAVYGLGLLGALVYYLQNANNFQQGVIGVIKAILWPALLIFNLLSYLNL